MDTFNEMMRKMVEKRLAQQLGELPPEAKAALAKTQVVVVRQPGRVEIVIDSGGDPDMEKARDVLLDSLLQPLAGIITFFGCKAIIEVAGDR